LPVASETAQSTFYELRDGERARMQNILAALAVVAPPRGRIRESLLPPVIAATAVPACLPLCGARSV
jgi:hypothetical protein